MLDTQRHDLIGAISDVVTDRNDRGKPYEKYLLDPARLLDEVALPPLYLVTSAEDLIQKDTLKLEAKLSNLGNSYQLLNFTKGTERKLVHVFPVMYPMYPESREVFREMDAFFKEAL